MAIGTVQGIGSTNVGVDRHDLNLKLFAGETMAQFERANKFLAMTRVKELAPGRKSEQFPAIGLASTKYAPPGVDLLSDAGFLNQIAHGERTIHADHENTSNVFMNRLEERISHINGRQEFTTQLGRALAKDVDQMILRVLMIAARNYRADPYTGAPQGEYINNAGAFTAATFVDALLTAQQKMDEKDVPEEDRFCAVSPAIFNLLLSSGATLEYIDTDINPMGNGSIREGKVYEIAGFTLVKTNNIPTDNYTSTENQIGASAANDYRCDASTSATKGICFQRQAVGTVRSMGIGIELETTVRHKGTLVSAGYSMGHGVLRPECVVELAEAAKPAAPV